MRRHRWLATVLALGIVAGGCMTELEPTRQPPSPLDATSAPSSKALPSASAVTNAGVVAYAKSDRIWVTDTSGADDRQLVAFELDPEKPRQLNSTDVQYPMAWSPDGARLYYRFERVENAVPDDGIGIRHNGLAMTDAAGSTPVELLDIATLDRRQVNPWCPAPVEFNNCQANLEGAAISGDGARLAFPIQEGRELNTSSIVVLDVATGAMTRLESTRTRNPGSLPNEGPNEPCTPLHGGYNEGLQWSPDGTRLVFTRFDCHNGVFTINADGSDLRELGLPGVPALYPRWSPDGSTITFHVATSDGTTVDVFTVQSDGTGLQALTNDGISVWPHWTRGGRIVFVRWTQPEEGLGDLWIMDADGANAAPVDATIPALTAADCTVCPYPDDQGHFWGGGRLNLRLWQPVPGH
jgi:Tol biopolymer transport system component